MFKLPTALTATLGLLVGSVGHSFVADNVAMSAAPTFFVQPEIIQPERYIGHPDNIEGWAAVHFKPSEFASKGNGLLNIDADLVNALDAVREEFGQPIRITSGYRDPEHNKRVGGAPKSKHVEGIAADIDLSGMDAQTRYRLMTLLIKHGFRAFGSYDNHPNMLHADLREFAVTWDYGDGIHPTWFLRALNDTGWQHGSEPFSVASATVELFEGAATGFGAPAQFHDMASNRTLNEPKPPGFSRVDNDEGEHRTEWHRFFSLEAVFDAETKERSLEGSLSIQEDDRSAHIGVTATHDRDPKVTAGIQLSF